MSTASSPTFCAPLSSTGETTRTGPDMVPQHRRPSSSLATTRYPRLLSRIRPHALLRPSRSAPSPPLAPPDGPDPAQCPRRVCEAVAALMDRQRRRCGRCCRISADRRKTELDSDARRRDVQFAVGGEVQLDTELGMDAASLAGLDWPPSRSPRVPRLMCAASTSRRPGAPEITASSVMSVPLTPGPSGRRCGPAAAGGRCRSRAGALDAGALKLKVRRGRSYVLSGARHVGPQVGAARQPDQL